VDDRGRVGRGANRGAAAFICASFYSMALRDGRDKPRGAD